MSPRGSAISSRPLSRSERHPEPVGTSTDIATLQVADIELPPEMERLRDLAYDLWWSWSPQATRLFTWIDPDHWRRYHNPVQLLINVEPHHWYRLLGDPEFRRTYESVIHSLDAYRARPRWFDQH